MRFGLTLLASVLCLSGATGCAPIEGRTTLLRGASVAPQISESRVEIIDEQADSDRFERVAELRYRTPGDNFDGAEERLLLDRLRREAAQLGADVLLDVRVTVEEDGIETFVTEQRTGDVYPDDRHRRWGTTTTTARVKTGPAYRTVATAIAARRR